MSGYHDLPDPPGEWRVMINKEKHINYSENVYGPCIIVTPSLGPMATGWGVTLIDSDNWDQAPRFAEEVELETAAQAVHKLIENIDSGVGLEPVGFVESTNGNSESDDTDPDDTTSDTNSDPDSDSSEEQSTTDTTSTDQTNTPDSSDVSDGQNETDNTDDVVKAEDNDSQIKLTDF